MADGHWVEKFDKAHQRTFYYNKDTQEKKWKLPSGVICAPPWIEKIDKATDKKFYVNSATGIKTWKKPDDDNIIKTPLWKKKHDPRNDRDYFVNTETHEKSWSNPAEIPAPWIRKTDDGSGKHYYYNTSTKEKTWKKPVYEKAENKENGVPPPWKKRLDPTSKRYFYYNPETNAKTWKNPAKLEKKEDGKKKKEEEERLEKERLENERLEKERIENEKKAEEEKLENEKKKAEQEMIKNERKAEEERLEQERLEQERLEEERLEEERLEQERLEEERVEKERLKHEKEEEDARRRRLADEKRIHYDWDVSADEQEQIPQETNQDEEDNNVIAPLAAATAAEAEANGGTRERDLSNEETTVLAPVPLGVPAVLPRYMAERRKRALQGVDLEGGGGLNKSTSAAKLVRGEPEPHQGEEIDAFAGAQGALELRDMTAIGKVQQRALFENAPQLYLPLSYRMMPYDFRFNYVGFTFSRYAKNNFDDPNPVNFMYSETQPNIPLLKKVITSGKEAQIKIIKKFYRVLTSFVIDKDKSDVELAKGIVAVRNQNSDLLYTEVYCQIIRQIRNCLDPKLAEHYWQALVCCLRNFLPNVSFELALVNFLASVIERRAINDIEQDLMVEYTPPPPEGEAAPPEDDKKKKKQKKDKKATESAAPDVPTKPSFPPAGVDPYRAWERQMDNPLVKREALFFAQYAFFLVMEGKGRGKKGGNINKGVPFTEVDVKKVMNYISTPNVFSCAVSESLFLQGSLDPLDPSFTPFFLPEQPRAPSLYHPSESPLNPEWLESTPLLVLPFGPDTDQNYNMHMAEIPVPFHLLYLTWRIKQTQGLRKKKIFLNSHELADPEQVKQLIDCISELNFDDAKRANIVDPHVYAAILREWLSNLPYPILSYTAEWNALLRDAPFDHPSNFDNMSDVTYTAAQMGCAVVCEKSLNPLLLLLLKYLIRFFRLFLEPQFARYNGLTAQSLSTSLASWLFGPRDEFKLTQAEGGIAATTDGSGGGGGDGPTKERGGDEGGRGEGGSTKTTRKKKAAASGGEGDGDGGQQQLTREGGGEGKPLKKKVVKRKGVAADSGELPEATVDPSASLQSLGSTGSGIGEGGEGGGEGSGSGDDDKRTRDQKKAILIFSLLHTLQPTEIEEELFASADDYARQWDKLQL